MKLTNPTGHKHVDVQANEHLEIELKDLEAGERSFKLEVNLIGENASCNVTGRVQSRLNDHKHWEVKQIFAGHNQTGSIDLRGTAEDESFLAFDGGALLAEASSQAEANVEERIILFDKARGRSLPILRVETDDVKSAAHGASIAPIEAEKILYLAAKGISKQEAHEMLKTGFLN